LDGQEGAAQWKNSSSPAVGKQAEVADAREPARQNVLEKTPQELLMSQGHDAAFAVVRIIFPAEGHVRVVDINQAVIRNRNPVRVSGQVMEHVFRSAEGLLGIHDPVFSEQRSHKGGECRGLGQ